MKKWVAHLLVGVMISSTTTAWASNYTDIGGHWAESAITTWSDRNVLSGYNNLFRPNDTITRGEMAVILDRIMYYTQKQQNTFSDLDQAFYTEPILKAAKAGVFSETNGLARPKEAMIRQDAVVMLAKALGIAPVEGSTNFTDDTQISTQAKGYILGMKQQGYVSGSSDGAFHPNDPISRAEVVTLLNCSIDNIVTENTVSASSNGKNVIINTPNVTLENTVIDKDLILAEGIGEGDVTLENITVKGSLIVRGGGIHTVKLKNSNIGNVSIEKKASAVRVLTENSTVTKTNVTTPSILEGNFNAVTISSPTDVTVRGNVETMEVSAKANLQTEGTATVKNVNITANGANTIVKGTGKVENVQIAGENVSIETTNTNVTVAQTVTQAKVNGQTVKGGTQTKTSSSAGNSGNKTSSSSGSSGSRPSSSGSGNNRPSGGGGSSSGSTTQKKITIKNVESVSNSLVRVTLSDATKQPLKQSDFSIICTGGGSNMTILNVRTTDNKVYDITTTYYKDNTYNLQVTIDGKYVDKDFVVKYDCAELTSVKTKRTNETTAEFSYISDTPGTLYYGLVKNTPVLAAYENEAGEKVSARSVFPDGTQPSAEQLIASGTKTSMDLELNTINITGLEKDTAYTLYYVAVDVKNRTTPVKQIAISAEAPAKPKPPTKPSKPSESEDYKIENISAYFNETGGFFDELYRFTVTFDKAVKEELKIENFDMTCPQGTLLHLGRLEKVDDKTYNVYMKEGYGVNEPNELTMYVTLANGKTIDKEFHFDVTPPDIKIVKNERLPKEEGSEATDEETINIEFETNKKGTFYYKFYDKDDENYEFGTTNPKNPDDIYATGQKLSLNYSNTLTGIKAKKGQLFCYATETPSGQRSGTFWYITKPVEEYPLAIVKPEDPNALKIESVKVTNGNKVIITLNKGVDIPNSDTGVGANNIKFSTLPSTLLSVTADQDSGEFISGEDGYGYYVYTVAIVDIKGGKLPAGENTIIITIGEERISFNFVLDENGNTVDSSTTPEPNPDPEPEPEPNPSNAITKLSTKTVNSIMKPVNTTVSDTDDNKNKENVDVKDNTDVKDDIDTSGNADVKDDTDANNNADVKDDIDASGNADVKDDTDANNNADVKDDIDTSGNADVKDDIDANNNADVKDDTDANNNADVKDDTDTNDVADTKEDTNSKENSDSSDTETEI